MVSKMEKLKVLFVMQVEHAVFMVETEVSEKGVMVKGVRLQESKCDLMKFLDNDFIDHLGKNCVRAIEESTLNNLDIHKKIQFKA